MIYVSVDLETTGIDPKTCQVLEIGAIVQELGGKELDRFHAILDYKELSGSPFALNMNQRLLQVIIDKKGQPPTMVWDKFYHWLERWAAHTEPTYHIVAAGKNFAGFDRPFIEQASPRAAKLFFRRVLDPAILYMTADDEVPPDLATCLVRAALPNEVTHNAIDDAAQVRDLIEYYFNFKG